MSGGMPKANIEDTLTWLQRMQAEVHASWKETWRKSAEKATGFRLRLEGVRLSLERAKSKAAVVLHDGFDCYVGEAESKGERRHGWLAAAATIAALNSYLQSLPKQTIRREIRLLETGNFRLASGANATYVRLEISGDGNPERILGAALEANWGLEAPAAAVLDAVNRRLSAPSVDAREESLQPRLQKRPAAAARRRETTSAIGVHLTATEARAIRLEADGKVPAQASRQCLPTSLPETALHQVLSAVQEALAEDGREADICGIGIALAGRIREGICLESPDFPGWQEVPLEEWVSEQLKRPVCLVEETKAALAAEARLGAGAGLSNILFFSSGPRLACAVMSEGKILQGASGAFAAGAHLVPSYRAGRPEEEGRSLCSCGQSGCWQSLASDSALVERTKARLARGEKSAILDFAEGEPTLITPGLLWRAAEAGDSLAREVLREGFYWVGQGLIGLIELCDPEAVIVSGPALPDEIWMPPLRESLTSRPAGRRAPLLTAKLGREGPVIGAALLAREIAP